MEWSGDGIVLEAEGNRFDRPDLIVDVLSGGRCRKFVRRRGPCAILWVPRSSVGVTIRRELQTELVGDQCFVETSVTSAASAWLFTECCDSGPLRIIVPGSGEALRAWHAPSDERHPRPNSAHRTGCQNLTMYSLASRHTLNAFLKLSICSAVACWACELCCSTC